MLLSTRASTERCISVRNVSSLESRIFCCSVKFCLSSIDGISFPQVPRKLAQAQAAFAQTRKQLWRDGLQDGFCIFVAARIVLAERVAASARLLQSSQQCFLRTFQHRQRIKHRCSAHLAAGQEDTAPTGRHRCHWSHCCQLTVRSHFRLHLQLQPEHRFCLFHVRSFF